VLAALSDALQGARTVEEVAHAALARLGPAVAADYLFLSPFRERVGIATSWGAVPPDVLAS
jgi:hypothetical protein